MSFLSSKAGCIHKVAFTFPQAPECWQYFMTPRDIALKFSHPLVPPILCVSWCQGKISSRIYLLQNYLLNKNPHLQSEGDRESQEIVGNFSLKLPYQQIRELLSSSYSKMLNQNLFSTSFCFIASIFLFRPLCCCDQQRAVGLLSIFRFN